MLEKVKVSGNYVFKMLEDQDEVKYYALNIKSGDCYEVNETTYDILLLMQKNNSFEQIFQRLIIKYKNLQMKEFEQDYKNLVDMCLKLEILKSNG